MSHSSEGYYLLCDTRSWLKDMFAITFDEENMDMWPQTNYLTAVKPYTHQISNHCDVTRRQTNEGWRICLHYRRGCLRTCAEYTSWVVLVNTWGRGRAETVERDLLVAYPLIEIRGSNKQSKYIPLVPPQFSLNAHNSARLGFSNPWSYNSYNLIYNR